MKKNRDVEDVRKLTDGPGKLTKAMKIDRELNGADIVSSHTLFLERGRKIKSIGVSSRVGVSAAKSFKWRFYVRGNIFVSKAKPSL